MVLPIYPPELPRPERRPYQVTRGDGRRWSQRQGGPPVPRPGFSTTADMVTLTTRLSAQHLARFDRFVEEEIARGLKPFLMPDPGRDGWPAYDAAGAPMLTAAGAPVLMARTWLCILGQQPVTLRIETGVSWQVTFEIAVMP